MSITRPRTITALALLSALALCAFAAPSVAQAGTGTTAFTCVLGGGAEDFADSHCKEDVGDGNGFYGHETIEVGTETKFHAESTVTSITIRGTAATLKLTITCTSATGTGFFKNEEPSAGNHTVTGLGIEITYTGCDLMVGKAEVTCSMKGGEFKMPSVKAMDVEGAHGSEMGIKFEPTKGSALAAFTAGADCPSIANQTFNITGSFLGVPHGSTLDFTEASTKPTLFLGGNPASMEDTETIGMLNEITGETENPISFTTTGE
jgi:hypothetical protein